MANNKVQLADGTTLIDLTGDTAIESDVASGKTFHLADGTQAVGTGTSGAFNSAKIVGGLWGLGSGTAWATLGIYSGSNANPQPFYDENFVTYANGVFTFVTAGEYKITYFGRGGYNSSGTAIYERFRFLPGSGWPSITGNTYANGGRSGSFTATVNAGDTLYVQTQNNSGSNTHDFGFIIELADGGGIIPWAAGEAF